jgi:peptide/nickel transport system permease protein
MTRARYLVYRTVQTVVMLWLVLTFLFFFFRLMPGSYTDLLVQGGATPETVAAFEERWGLNDPLHIQYVRYLINFIALDFGESLQFQQSVWEYVSRKIFNSLILVAPGITAGYLLGSSIGVFLGTNQGKATEKYGVLPIIFIGTIPLFFLGILFVILFAGVLDWFPTSGMLSPGTSAEFGDRSWWRVYLTGDFAYHYVLPFTAIAIRYSYLPSLIMRTSIVEVKNQGFTYYHRITGLSKRKRLKHLAKHASLPVITLFPVSMTRAIGGLVLIEIVFNWPGIGNALVRAVLARDFPVVQFVFFLVAAFVIIGNYLVDIVYGFVDPRVSVEN